jgi:hypothetical protein
MTEVGVFGTIALAVGCWALAECLRISARLDHGRLAWTVGAIALLVHSAWAFSAFYAWSAQLALAATARQTHALTGIDWGGGLYVNYLLLAVWILDASWWWSVPDRYAMRRSAVDYSVRGFLFFMMVNGAVVFADGLMRVFGMLAVGVVSLAWLTKRYKPAVF